MRRTIGLLRPAPARPRGWRTAGILVTLAIALGLTLETRRLHWRRDALERELRTTNVLASEYAALTADDRLADGPVSAAPPLLIRVRTEVGRALGDGNDGHIVEADLDATADDVATVRLELASVSLARLVQLVQALESGAPPLAIRLLDLHRQPEDPEGGSAARTLGVVMKITAASPPETER